MRGRNLICGGVWELGGVGYNIIFYILLQKASTPNITESTQNDERTEKIGERSAASCVFVLGTWVHTEADSNRSHGPIGVCEGAKFTDFGRSRGPTEVCKLLFWNWAPGGGEIDIRLLF